MQHVRFFYSLNFSAVKTEGLLYTHQPLNPHNLLKSTTPSLPVPTLLPLNERSICFASALSLSFRRASVCVCLVGFASLQSPWAHTLKASLPCLPLPLHRPSPFLQPSQKHIHRLAPHHVLASLVKGRWIDGKAQVLILLLSACDTSAFSIYQTFCRQDEGIALHPPTSPSPATVAKSQPPLAPHHVLALLAPVAPNTATFASIFLIQYTNYGFF